MLSIKDVEAFCKFLLLWPCSDKTDGAVCGGRESFGSYRKLKSIFSPSSFGDRTREPSDQEKVGANISQKETSKTSGVARALILD